MNTNSNFLKTESAFLSGLKEEASIDGYNEIIREYVIGKFHAFLVKGSPVFVSGIGSHPFIKYYQKNGVVHALGAKEGQCTSVAAPSWGLTRVAFRNKQTSQRYEYTNDGRGVTAYIIDTGIYIEHNDFEGRAVWGGTFTGDGNDKDCNGHGTHVAGTVGGKEHGIAKKVDLVAVKVLNCMGSGSYSGVVAGIEWVAQQHKKRGTPSTANMSLGGPKSQIVDDAVRAAVEAGVVMCVAAGNDQGDACKSSPANVPVAITVGSTTIDDQRSSFSSVGTCVDIFAPGTGITSAWIGSPTATRTISGTSMATPHVCGVTAQILQENPSASPQRVKDIILENASSNIIDLDCNGWFVDKSCKDSPNKLLYSGC